MGVVDWDDLLLSPGYDLLGTDAILSPTGSLAPVAVVVLDRTKGVEIDGQHLGVSTLTPACDVRMADLIANAITRYDLPHGEITLNGATWRIERTAPMPLDGEAGGQLRLYLSE